MYSLANLLLIAMDDADGIDFKKLEKEFAAAVEADAKYQRENDAKFRAVEQRVGTYEEFRDIVAASHLRPLDKKDITGENARKQPWNPHANKSEQTNSNRTQTSSAIGSDDSALPRNAHEFDRSWRRSCRTDSEKYRLLCRIGEEGLQKIFKTEISFGLLGEFVQVLGVCLEDGDAAAVYSILLGLSKTNRFSLSLQFLSGKEKQMCVEIFENLERALTKEGSGFTEQDVSQLAQVYGAK